MTDQSFPQKTTLVMAHPDDEILWASSVLEKMNWIVHCFEEIPSHPRLGNGRRRSLAEFPLPNAVSLRLTESEVFDGASWPLPIETGYGLEVKRTPRSMSGFSVARYRNNFDELLRALRPLLSDAPSVLTHSPWGEYGHDVLVQVFRAVLALRAELGYAIWIPGYVSDKAYPLMLRTLSGIEVNTRIYAVDPELTRRVKELYSRNRCWTWFDDYVWPAHEFFYEWTEPKRRPREALSVNILRIEMAKEAPRPSRRRLTKRIGRRIKLLLKAT